ncbi:MAG: hypothetical protein R6U55_16000 [Desulfovermiculus sp.]
MFDTRLSGFSFACGKPEIFFAPKRAKKEKFAGLIIYETVVSEGQGLRSSPSYTKARLASRPPGTHFENGRLFLIVTFEIKVSAGQDLFEANPVSYKWRGTQLAGVSQPASTQAMKSL